MRGNPGVSKLKREPLQREHSDLIDRLGGPNRVANILRVRLGVEITERAVGQWRDRGIAYRYRVPIADVAQARNIALPTGFLHPSPPKVTHPQPEQNA